MESILRALQIAQDYDCSYCDVRTETVRKQGVLVENGSQEHIAKKQEGGIGIRILYDGAWGFYSTSYLQEFEDGLVDTIKAAKLASQKKKKKIKLANNVAAEKTVRRTMKKEPTVESITEIALECDRIIRANKRIMKSSVEILQTFTSRYFANSEGSRILQEFSDLIADLTATAHQYGITQSISRTEGGIGGLETITDKTDIFEVSDQIAKKAGQLLDAKTVDEDRSTVVMNPDFVALLTHEILGHPSEADRVLGREMAWAGGAWWSGMLGCQIGSSALNVIDDPTIEDSLGWYEFDDEGVKSKRKQLVKEGVLSEHMHSRETAYDFNVEPNASMRATSYRFMPLIRMSCTCIEGGTWSQEEMIKDVKHGYLISDMKIPSIDMRRHNWSISCQYANRIEDGRITELLRDVIVTGTAQEFFRSIDACGKDFTVRPITNCGKGDPMQQMKMGNGGPSIRGIATVKSTT